MRIKSIDVTMPRLGKETLTSTDDNVAEAFRRLTTRESGQVDVRAENGGIVSFVKMSGSNEVSILINNKT